MKGKKTSQKVPYFSASWDEGRVFDLWMIAHITSGMTLGALFSYLNTPEIVAIVLGLMLLTLWEIFEIYKKIVESPENRFLDILVGFAGLYLTYSYLAVFENGDKLLFFILLILATVILNTLGWRAYIKRRRDKKL